MLKRTRCMRLSHEPASTQSGRYRCRIQRRVSNRVVRWSTAILTLLALYTASGLRLNLTGSMPVGLYLNTRGTLARGSIVLACLPGDVAAEAMVRDYVPRGGSCPHGTMPVGKPVLALPGDTIIVAATTLLLNGVAVPNSGALSSDRKGRRLPVLQQGKYHVSPGEVWLLSTHSPFSFDSRYFGAVKTIQILTHVRPLWIAGGRTCLDDASLRCISDSRVEQKRYIYTPELGNVDFERGGPIVQADAEQDAAEVANLITSSPVIYHVNTANRAVSALDCSRDCRSSRCFRRASERAGSLPSQRGLF